MATPHNDRGPMDPCDPKQADQDRAWGFSYIVGSPILLGLLYLLLRFWMSAVARASAAPDQGAMLTCILIFVVGGITALVFFVRGVVLATPRRKDEEK
jgi:hypothetical protein